MLDPESEEDELNITARNVVGKKVEKLTNLHEVLDIAQHIFDTVKMSDYGQQYKVRLFRNTRPHRVQGRAARTVKEYIRVGISRACTSTSKRWRARSPFSTAIR